MVLLWGKVMNDAGNLKGSPWLMLFIREVVGDGAHLSAEGKVFPERKAGFLRV